jgi:hypothetical protein
LLYHFNETCPKPSQMLSQLLHIIPLATKWYLTCEIINGMMHGFNLGFISIYSKKIKIEWKCYYAATISTANNL